jgi:hypothetical protein
MATTKKSTSKSGSKAAVQALPLMPKATAIWLIDNTGLTFDQIAAFCGLHILEVQALADGDVAPGMQGTNPIMAGVLSQTEIARCETDSAAVLKALENRIETPDRTAGPRYTPLSKRQDKPDAVAWILRSHPEVPDHAIVKLLGTTKGTIAAIRDRTHWNYSNIRPRHPVGLDICKQVDLDAVLTRYPSKTPVQDASSSHDGSDDLHLPDIV